MDADKDYTIKCNEWRHLVYKPFIHCSYVLCELKVKVKFVRTKRVLGRAFAPKLVNLVYVYRTVYKLNPLSKTRA